MSCDLGLGSYIVIQIKIHSLLLRNNFREIRTSRILEYPQIKFRNNCHNMIK